LAGGLVPRPTRQTARGARAPHRVVPPAGVGNGCAGGDVLRNKRVCLTFPAPDTGATKLGGDPARAADQTPTAASGIRAPSPGP
jgi:hypothetical protein